MVLFLIVRFLNIGKYEIFYSCYEKNQLQKEYHLILESLGEAVITNTETGIKYFNQLGYKLLLTCAEGHQ